MAKDKNPDGKKDEGLDEGPLKPGRRRPSEWGVGREHSTPPSDPDSSPTSKAPL